MHDTYTKIDNVAVKTDRISVKDIIEGLRKISAKQKTIIEKAVKQEIAEQKKMFRKDKSCKVCSDIVLDMKNRSQIIVEDAHAIIEMYRNRTDELPILCLISEEE